VQDWGTAVGKPTLLVSAAEPGAGGTCSLLLLRSTWEEGWLCCLGLLSFLDFLEGE
jgi:hypothetical protein